MMIDTNIIIDLREEDSQWFDWSVRAMANAVDGRRTTSAIVLGELMSRGAGKAEIGTQLAVFEIDAIPLSVSAALRAGRAHHAYRQAGGTRDRLLGDFLIGAHAVDVGEPLLTRDPRRYRSYFPELILITPESHP